MTPTNNAGLHLADFSLDALQCREKGYGFAEFRQLPKARQLRWPDDVLEQWVFDHAGYDPFLNDYGEIDLSGIDWQVETLPVEDFVAMPTGPSDGDAIECYEADPDHSIAVRKHGVHMGVKLCWETHGTWKRWPIVLDRDLINPGDQGLQLVEGRTRVGVLRGRMLRGQPIAERHLVWIGRPSKRLAT